MNLMTPGQPTAAQSTLNEGQQAAVDGFFQFLFSDEKEMGISGPGGVGKTYVMGEMVDAIMPRYHETCELMGITPTYVEVIMGATTNKASEQLAKAIKRPVPTIQSALNLRVSDDFKTGQSKLVKKDTWTVYENKIFFIDECSMIDSHLYGHILAGTLDCKIVYIGDHCQLAPVMETMSPIYRKGIPFYNLTEPMRTNVPELQALNQQMRTTVETGVFQPIQIVPGIIDHFDDAQMEAVIAAEFSQQTTSAKILAYTNKRVTQYNDHIRDLRQLPNHYTVGEMLVNNTAVHLKKQMLNTEQEVEITSISSTSEMLEVEPGVQFEYRRANLRSPSGEMFLEVPLPWDRDHFTALVKHYSKSKNWSKFYQLKNFYPDLRPNDASTVYKAQGSTYDTVIIDLTNISTCHNANQVARMLYVAVSRPRTRVIFYGQLAEKYGSLIY